MNMETAVRGALGDKFDPKASYVVVRPGQRYDAKFAKHEVVGELVEDTRHETTMLILKRPAPKANPLPAAANVLRSMLGRK